MVIYMVAGYIQAKNIQQNKLYKWYRKGLLVKVGGAVAVCLVYQFYYEGGDTVNYYENSRILSNMIFKDRQVFFDILFGENSTKNFMEFDSTTGIPMYWRDDAAFFVSRLFVPLAFISFQSFIVMSMILSWICYTGIWRLFLLFNEHFPNLQKQFAISFLFIPSVVFWGSGLLKDSITLSAVGWYTYHFYSFLIKKEYNFKSAIYIFLSSYLLICIKPYIFFALLPGSLIWLSNEKLATVRSSIIKALAAPFFLLVGVTISFFLLSQLTDVLGIYSLDKVMERAVVVNLDQKQEYYGGNSFDIGAFNADPLSMLSKAHLAIMATLFRPYLWDAKNLVMFFSAVENTCILLLTIFLLVRLKFFNFFTLIGKNPLLLFSVLFSLFFAFSVGLATSNFGSLVRLKIPCIPFYVSSLFVLKYFYDQKSHKADAYYQRKQEKVKTRGTLRT